MASNTLSFIVTCKGRLEQLKQSLPLLAEQLGSEVIVVDYDCPDGTAAWIASDYPSVKVVEVFGRPVFNRCEARNRGADAARTPWLCFIDADILADPEFSSAIHPMLSWPDYLVAHPPSPQKHGTIVVAKKDFLRIGGYDEVFEGWGWEDFDIRERLDLANAVERTFPSNLLAEIEHSDSERTRFHLQKAKNLSAKQNLIYMLAKLNLMRLEGSEISKAVRRKLYDEVRKITLARPISKEVELSVSLPTRRIYNMNVVEERTLKLKLRIDEAEPHDPGSQSPAV